MKKKQLSPVKLLLPITLVIFAVIVAFVVMNNTEKTTTENKVSKNLPSIGNQPTLGDENAPVSIVEFGDYKCPACKAWGEQIFPELQKDYIDTGKIKFSYVNVLFHGEESKLAALAAESVYKQDPQSYWTFHKEIFNAQPQNHDDPWITSEKLLEIARTHTPNIDTAQLEEDINNQTMQNEVSRDNQLVQDYGVSLTPSIVINNTMLSDPYDYEEIKRLIEKALEEKKQ
ncbi:dihydroneopterin aldolase [Bacillus manliponensis]|uniref:Dihydroneopterin aldolase n=1 Tax=Bacillus manliponensis TaxID=574376 RepID=A0A073KC17_9BACI|nr:DsbA family protein [Bacillus manliponensis]KEK19833.1 dihydroneopterin aldolase [Bacillus manliponensis]